jgi:uncharacterized protein (DUF58 family)
MAPPRSTTVARAWHPLAFARSRFRAWWLARLPQSDAVELTQRNVYILPTRAGLMLGVTLLVLLVTAINYQLNLGYLLTFLLAGSAAASMGMAHATLRGLTLSLAPPEATFCGASARLRVSLGSQRGTPRHGIGLSVLGSGQWAWCDVPAQGHSVVELCFAPERRGLHPVPALTAETRFPLGTFRVWTLWRPAAQVLVYPRPEAQPPPLPAAGPHGDGPTSTSATHGEEFDGVRPYRRGDALKNIVWKKAAKADTLVSRDNEQAHHAALWLDLAQTGGGDLEHRLSRLCAWVLEAERLELDYGLRLPGVEVAPAHGEGQERRCLEVLALWTA